MKISHFGALLALFFAFASPVKAQFASVKDQIADLDIALALANNQTSAIPGPSGGASFYLFRLTDPQSGQSSTVTGTTDNFNFTPTGSTNTGFNLQIKRLADLKKWELSVSPAIGVTLQNGIHYSLNVTGPGQVVHSMFLEDSKSFVPNGTIIFYGKDKDTFDPNNFGFDAMFTTDNGVFTLMSFRFGEGLPPLTTIDFVAIPEPSTVILLLLGAIALLAKARLRSGFFISRS